MVDRGDAPEGALAPSTTSEPESPAPITGGQAGSVAAGFPVVTVPGAAGGAAPAVGPADADADADAGPGPGPRTGPRSGWALAV